MTTLASDLYYLARDPAQAVQDGRDWLLDCWDDPEVVEHVTEASAVTIVGDVHRHYQGGYVAFLKDGFNLARPMDQEGV